VYLFWDGSYNVGHPYYQKVIDLYGKKPGFERYISETTVKEIKFHRKTLATLLDWSPIERKMLGDEAEREFKRIKSKK
jgi:hypothetical protein